MGIDRATTIRAALDRYNEQDMSGVLALLHPDVEMYNMIHGSTLHGKEAVEAFWRKQLNLAEQWVIPVEVIEAGNTVIVITHTQHYEPGGRSYGDRRSTVQRLIFSGDQIVRVEVTAVDTAS